MRKGIRMTGLRELVQIGGAVRKGGQEAGCLAPQPCPAKRAGALGDKVEEVSRA